VFGLRVAPGLPVSLGLRLWRGMLADVVGAGALDLAAAGSGSLVMARGDGRGGLGRPSRQPAGGWVAIPKVREGSYFPDFLLEPRRRAEQALVSVVADAYLQGVSTRKVDKLVRSMGLDGISRTQVSEMAKSLDEKVDSFRHRPLDDTSPGSGRCRLYAWLQPWIQSSKSGQVHRTNSQKHT